LWRRKDKHSVTVLYNVVERRKSFFLRAFWERNGFRCIDMGDHRHDDMRLGKEFGNRMECNPMYFTCGSLLRSLFDIERETGKSKEQIVRDYVFIGGGGQCGPCRYGMYPQEYRKALDDAGFIDFRMVIFSSGFSSETQSHDAALKINLPFRINLCYAVVLADLLHIAECALRPFATDKTKALRAIDRAERVLLNAFRSRWYFFTVPQALTRVSRIFRSVPRSGLSLPLIYVTGEFFANLAHNDGNYNLRRFIMDEGCEVYPGLFTNRILYDFWRQIKLFGRALRYERTMRKKTGALVAIMQAVFRRLFVRFLYRQLCRALAPEQFGGRCELYDFDHLARLGRDYYHPEIFGGEGNLEVAEAIHYAGKVDGFISSKPFGCLSSSGVSDGVQAKITAMYPSLNFLSIETSGDNEVSILSRVSMMLFKAKQKVMRDGVQPNVD
jgi:predicted nucleotide-binding protein (sugar kinase/HSP70/actin superfamily)